MAADRYYVLASICQTDGAIGKPTYGIALTNGTVLCGDVDPNINEMNQFVKKLNQFDVSADFIMELVHDFIHRN